MAFTLEHVQQVRNGQPRQVGALPDDVALRLGWPCPWVYLGKSGLEHIAAGHPDIDDFDICWIPLAIESGLIVRLEKSPRKALIAYRADPARFYLGALKAAQGGTEIWVDSFYRIDRKKFDRMSGGPEVLRPHE
jgi:hypothetical protein